MATSYDTESAANKALIDNWAGNLRALLGTFYRIVVDAEALDSQYTQEISGLLSAWNATEEIPNNSGLAGSSPSETHEVFEQWQGYVQTLKSSLGTSGHKDNYVSAAGPDNTTEA